MAQYVTPSEAEINSRRFGPTPIARPISGPNGIIDLSSHEGTVSRGGRRPASPAVVSIISRNVVIRPPRTYDSPMRPPVVGKEEPFGRVVDVDRVDTDAGQCEHAQLPGPHLLQLRAELRVVAGAVDRTRQDDDDRRPACNPLDGGTVREVFRLVVH